MTRRAVYLLCALFWVSVLALLAGCGLQAFPEQPEVGAVCSLAGSGAVRLDQRLTLTTGDGIMVRGWWVTPHDGRMLIVSESALSGCRS